MNKMEKNNKRLIFIIFSFIALVLSVCSLSVSLIMAANSKKESNNYLKDAINSVVELKSVIDENNVEYGSAILVSDDGLCYTNAHLVVYSNGGVYKEFNEYYVRFSFEKEFVRSELISYDAEKDIAIIKITEMSKTYQKSKIGDSSKIAMGDTVYAIGNGLNHGIGLTKGYVSIPRVEIQSEGAMRSVIQCDLTINSGNSGGGLFNDKGELIGITTFRIKDLNGNIAYGLAFSVPVEYFSELPTTN